MNICITHNQSYDPKKGDFCPYCGIPAFNTATSAGYYWLTTCPVCGQYRTTHNPHTCVVITSQK